MKLEMLLRICHHGAVYPEDCCNMAGYESFHLQRGGATVNVSTWRPNDLSQIAVSGSHAQSAVLLYSSLTTT